MSAAKSRSIRCPIGSICGTNTYTVRVGEETTRPSSLQTMPSASMKVQKRDGKYQDPKASTPEIVDR